MTPGRLLLAAACGLSALYAAGLVYEMDFARPGCCGLGWPHPDPVAAERWMAAADAKGRNPAIQRGAALALLAAQPADARAWMRLAWADRLSHGRLTKAGAGALDMNFRRAPFLASGRGFAAQLGAGLARAAGVKLAFNAEKLRWLSRQRGSLVGTYLVLRGLMEPEQVARAYGCDAAQAQRVFDDVKERLSAELRGIEGSWSSISYLETRFYLVPRLLRDSDWTGMAHSVEIRTPLVDWQLWNRVRLLIARQQERHARTKRELMAPAMGPQISEIIPRRKLGFENPYREMETLARERGWRAKPSMSSQQNWARFVMDRWLQSLTARTDELHPIRMQATAGTAGP